VKCSSHGVNPRVEIVNHKTAVAGAKTNAEAAVASNVFRTCRGAVGHVVIRSCVEGFIQFATGFQILREHGVHLLLPNDIYQPTATRARSVCNVEDLPWRDVLCDPLQTLYASAENLARQTETPAPSPHVASVTPTCSRSARMMAVLKDHSLDRVCFAFVDGLSCGLRDGVFPASR
jgi:hypothetical protein